MMPVRDARVRAEKAHALRSVGYTWEEIAQQLGFASRRSACEAARRHRERMGPASADEARDGLVTACRLVHSALFGRFAGAIESGDDVQAVAISREMTKTRDQWARLTGAFSPEEARLDVSVAPSVIVEQAHRQLLAAIEARWSE